MNFLIDCANTSFQPIFTIIRSLITILKIAVPILLVVYGMLDLGKAIISSKEDEMKKAQGALIKRVIYAIAVFLVVTIVQLVMTVVSEADTSVDDQSWYHCLYGQQEESQEPAG